MNASFQQFSVCYVSSSVLHNPECPLIPCLIVLRLFIFQNSGCSGANFSVKPYLTSRPLLVYFQNTSACLACTEVVPYVSVCLARLYGQGFTAPVSGSFMLVSFPVIVFNNIG